MGDDRTRTARQRPGPRHFRQQQFDDRPLNPDAELRLHQGNLEQSSIACPDGDSTAAKAGLWGRPLLIGWPEENMAVSQSHRANRGATCLLRLFVQRRYLV